jgi:hypothetical protein
MQMAVQPDGLSNLTLYMAKEDKRKKPQNVFPLFCFLIYLSFVRLVTPTYGQVQLETCSLCQIAEGWVQHWTTFPICMKQCLLILFSAAEQLVSHHKKRT